MTSVFSNLNNFVFIKLEPGFEPSDAFLISTSEPYSRNGSLRSGAIVTTHLVRRFDIFFGAKDAQLLSMEWSMAIGKQCSVLC